MSAAGYQRLWAALTAPTEPVAERPALGPDDPQADYESVEVYFARVGASTPPPPARRSRAKGADDAAK